MTSFKPNDCLKISSPNSITLRVMASVYELGRWEDTIQFRADQIVFLFIFGYYTIDWYKKGMKPKPIFAIFLGKTHEKS